MGARGTDQCKGFLPRCSGTAEPLRYGSEGHFRLFQGRPKCPKPRACGTLPSECGRNEITENALYGGFEDFPHQRSSKLRAMMPRRISRVPPRSEKDGAS